MAGPINLGDGLLIEILQRLPTAKHVIQCKLVCKHWQSIISCPYFIRCFCDHHDSEEAKPFATLFQYWKPRLQGGSNLDVLVASKNPKFFESDGFKLTFLPCSEPLNPHSVRIVASYNDLILCQSGELDQRVLYYICNPVTKDWVALPPVPDKFEDVPVGFLCDSNMSSYRVVRIPESSNYSCLAEIYCSETNQWTDRKSPVLHTYELESHYVLRWLCGNGFAWNGILYWITSDNKILAYNPYKQEECRLINEPVDTRQHRNFLGIYKGSLQLLQLFTIDHASGSCWDYSMRLWELNNYETEEWSLKKKGFMDPLLLEKFRRYREYEYINNVALDLNEEGVVYFSFACGRYVHSYNMWSRKLEVVQRIPCDMEAKFSKNCYQIVLPWWPTVIPAVVPHNALP